MKKLDINKFSIAQMTANGDGKTSSSGTMGCLCVVVGSLGFIVGVIDFYLESKGDIMMQSIVVIGIGAGLLGYRKSQATDVPVEQQEEIRTPAPEESSEERPSN